MEQTKDAREPLWRRALNAYFVVCLWGFFISLGIGPGENLRAWIEGLIHAHWDQTIDFTPATVPGLALAGLLTIPIVILMALLTLDFLVVLGTWLIAWLGDVVNLVRGTPTFNNEAITQANNAQGREPNATDPSR